MKRLMPILLIFATTGCGITGPNNVTLRAQGTVTNEATGQPISGASVKIFPPTIIFGTSSAAVGSTTTDAQGRYSVSATVGSKCLGNGFGFEVMASTLTLGSESTVLKCASATQQIDFALAALVP